MCNKRFIIYVSRNDKIYFFLNLFLFLKMTQPEKRKYPLKNSSNKKCKNILNESTKVNANHNITTKPTSVQEIINKIGQSNCNRKSNVSNVSSSFSPINIYERH